MSDKSISSEIDENTLVFVIPPEEKVATLSEKKEFAKSIPVIVDYAFFEKAVYEAGIDVFEDISQEDLGVQADSMMTLWKVDLMTPVKPVLEQLKGYFSKLRIQRYGVNLHAWVAVSHSSNYKRECVIEIAPEIIKLRII